MTSDEDDSIAIVNGPTIERITDQKQSKATERHLIIRRYFQKSTETDLQELHKWHEKYIASNESLYPRSAIIQEVLSDKLDQKAVDECVAELAEHVTVTKNFCVDCQHLFDHWPDLRDLECKETHWPATSADPWDSKHAVATLVLESAALNGCRFCAFVVQVMKDAEVLDIFRMIEMRLAYLDDTAMTSLSLQNWNAGSYELLWVNFPGKVSELSTGVAR